MRRPYGLASSNLAGGTSYPTTSNVMDLYIPPKLIREWNAYTIQECDSFRHDWDRAYRAAAAWGYQLARSTPVSGSEPEIPLSD